MKPAYRLIEGPYVQDLLDQPRAVEETAQALARIDLGNLPGQVRDGAYDRVVLTGMGASHHVLQAVAPPLLSLGMPVVAVETAELIHAQANLLSPRALLIAVSQSGRSVETLRLLDRVPSNCHLVGVTNDRESPLADRAQTSIILCAGKETTVSCKTYVATVAGLLWLTGVLQGGEPAGVARELGSGAEAIARYLSGWRDHTEALAKLLAPIHHLLLVGRGTSLAAAQTGALIIKEAARFPAEALSTAALRHGPIEMLSPEIAVLILKGAGTTATLNQNLHRELQAQGANAYLVDRQGSLPALCLPNVNDTLLALVEILPFQVTSLALAALTGHQAGEFRRATKVTAVE